MANSDHLKEKCFYEEWMNIQQQEVSELQQAARLHENGHYSEDELKQLVQKVMVHFEYYIEKRKLLARRDVAPYFPPTWCSSLENSGLWIGGCRPSSHIRLLYVLCGQDIESNLSELFRGSRTGNIGDLSGQQLHKLDKLHRETVRKENSLSASIASLQEDMVDQPLAAIATKSSEDGDHTRDVQKALDEQEKAMASVLEEADKLRLNLVKKVSNILPPAQCVDFLAAGKKLKLCMQEWGKKRDHDHGRELV